MDRFDRIKGVMFGIACGDALGATLEFFDLDENHVVLTEIVGGGIFNLEPGEVTDDTDMTLCVAKGILSNPENPINEIGSEWIKWYKANPIDVGNIIRIVINNYLNEKNWKVATKMAHDELDGESAGNGSLMRTAPISFYKDMEDVEKWSIEVSKMTHYDSLADEACLIYNKILYRLMNGEDKDKVIMSEIKDTKYVDILKFEKYNLKPTGFVVDTLECVLWCCLTEDSFKDIVVKAANLGGDADTIAAIAGGIAGAYYGYDSIPDSWKDKIIIKDKLMKVCENFKKDVNFS